jgi:hypothetical protein
MIEHPLLAEKFLQRDPWLFPINPGNLVHKVTFRVPEGLLTQRKFAVKERRENRRKYLDIYQGPGCDHYFLSAILQQPRSNRPSEVTLLLDVEGRWKITKQNAVWSPLGWLGKV